MNYLIAIGATCACFACYLIWILFEKIRGSRSRKPLKINYSSKLKNLYLELHNYSFFHSPEGMKKSYSRYIGRVKLREKLRTILTNSETRSGAYLITGFRGMGKTSLVRKAIVEMKGNHYYSFARHVRLFLVLTLMLLWHTKVIFSSYSFINILYPFWILSIVSIIYLAIEDKSRPDIWGYYLTKYRHPRLAFFGDWMASILRILDPEIDFFKRSKFKTLLQDIVLITVMYSLFALTGFEEGKDLFYVGFIYLLKVSLGYFAVVYLYNNFTLEKSAKLQRYDIVNLFYAVIRVLKNAIRRLDFGNKVVIEVSLSQDELKETEILKLLARKIYTEYKYLRNRLFAPNRLIIPVLLYSTIYLIVTLFYYHKPIYSEINEFRLKSGIVEYLPSQAQFPIIRHFQKAKVYKEISKETISEFPPDFQVDTRDIYEVNSIDTVTLDWLKYKKIIRISNNSYIQALNKKMLEHFSQDSLFRYQFSNAENEIYLRDPKNGVRTKLPTISYTGESPVRDLIVLLDLSIQYYYRKIFHPVIPITGNLKITRDSRFHEDMKFLPLAIDYLFFLVLATTFMLSFILARNSWRFGITNHRKVLKRLKFLNESITSQITHDQSGGVGYKQALSFSRRKSRIFPIAGVREIELELIDILEEIDKIPNLSTKPEFIFVFDELDKIEANYNATIQEKESQELASFGQGEEGYFSTENIRRRQETIARILGNLKLFFNTARAKFIFIAGREMFDASLADVSDRESFISSVFHDIIYVDSFFKDTSNLSNGGNSYITGTTEEFVCQLLLPRFSRYSRNLLGYNEYLKDNFSLKEDSFRSLRRLYYRVFKGKRYQCPHKQETPEQILMRRKAVFLVEQFIIFLTYRGNGAPKKITKLLEGFVTNPSKKELFNPNYITFGRNSRNLYLFFDYSCQYRLGLTHYLFKPYIHANSNHSKDLGDKMLLATSFLMDHLYKYHRVGFSWENLELTPEIIAVNKSPDLRTFIGRLVDFLGESHIEPIINGLYQFKFNIRIASEIKYVSTISETESAAFNFTLDESLVLKRHYRKKLNSMIKTYETFFNDSSKKEYHNDSIAMINMILGDLHFYDREYDEAIIHYNNALQDLGNNMESRVFDVKNLVFLIRHHLKLGLTYERMHDYENAFIIYGSLTKVLRNYSSHSKNSWGKDQKENIRIKKKVFENIRTVYQPLIAQFVVIEKGSPNGLSAVDVFRVLDELCLLTKYLESSEKFLVETEFYNKVGDILYYKNGMLTSKTNDKLLDEEPRVYFSEEEEIRRYRKYLVDSDPIFKRLPSYNHKGHDRDYRVPMSAFNLYKHGLELFVERLVDLNPDLGKDYPPESPPLIDILDVARKFISSEYFLGVSDDNYQGDKRRRSNKQLNMMTAVAGNLSDLGDSLVCFLSAEDHLPISYLKRLLEGSKVWSGERLIENLGKLSDDSDKEESVKVQCIFYLYLLANQYYLRVGSYYKGSLQIKKMLLLIRRVNEYNEIRLKNNLPAGYFENLQFITRRLAIEAFQLIDRCTHFTRRQQIYEWEDIFNLDQKGAKKQEIFYSSFLVQPEAFEVYTLVKQIELTRHLNDTPKLFELVIKSKLATPYTLINSKYNRVFELYYKCDLHFNILRNLENGWLQGKDYTSVKEEAGLLERLLKSIKKIPEFKKWEGDEKSFLSYLISDSIYCLSEVIRTFNVFGVSYMSNHSLNGFAHEHFAMWCFYYQTFKVRMEYVEFFEDLENRTRTLLGNTDVQYLDAGYHLKMAVQHYYSAIEMHNGGTAYRNALQNLYYLDDDFDNSLSHFCAALERFRVNSGVVRSQIISIKEKIKKVDTYNAEGLLEFEPTLNDSE